MTNVSFSASDRQLMQAAVSLASRGQGSVEPNPMVGCVIAQGDQIVGQGWHQAYGGPHAEAHALDEAGLQAAGSTVYVTLEPCSHTGKTPPCADALIAAQVRRVVVAQRDPFPQVDGRGITRLQQAGIQVDVGLMEAEATRLNAPYLKRVTQRRPWVIAKWAMTLDGKIASHQHHSQWISSPPARQVVHQLRGRVDGIMVGSQTALDDDPLLTARPSGARVPARIVVDSQARTPTNGQLVRSADQAAVIIATGPTADPNRCQSLTELGCELIACPGDDHLDRLDQLLQRLAERDMTNLLVEGGGRLLGNLLDINQIDEVHVFIAPKLIGGEHAVVPMAGLGRATMDRALHLDQPNLEIVGDDVYLHGRVQYSEDDTA